MLYCLQVKSFHSTDCPSEWGHVAYASVTTLRPYEVSIQLIAPASGAGSNRNNSPDRYYHVSIQLIAPASGAQKG